MKRTIRTTRTGRSRAAVAAALLAPALLLTACGGSGVSVPGVSVGPSGEVSISSSDGSFELGGAKIPQGFPSEVPQPEGFTLESSAKLGSEGKQNFTLSYTAAGNQSDAVTAYVESLKSAGFTLDSEFTGDSGGSNGGIYTLKNASWTVGVISSIETDKTAVILNVTPVSG